MLCASFPLFCNLIRCLLSPRQIFQLLIGFVQEHLGRLAHGIRRTGVFLGRISLKLMLLSVIFAVHASGSGHAIDGGGRHGQAPLMGKNILVQALGQLLVIDGTAALGIGSLGQGPDGPFGNTRQVGGTLVLGIPFRNGCGNVVPLGQGPDEVTGPFLGPYAIGVLGAVG